MKGSILNNKVVFIVDYCFTQRDYHRYGVEYFEQKGYQTEIWILRAQGNFLNDTLSYKGNNCFSLDFVGFIKRLKKMGKNTSYICYAPYDNIYGLLLLRNREVMIMKGMGAQPQYPFWDQSHSDAILQTNKIKKIIARKIKWILSSVPSAYKKSVTELCRHQIKKRRHKLVASTQYYVKNSLSQFEKNLSDLVITHAMNYDRVVELGRGGLESKDNQIVFCDSGFLEVDYDSMILNSQTLSALERKEGYQKLECLFEKMEELYKMPIVIAGHPHTLYREDSFCGREIILDRTPELILHSRMVILNASSAINLAIYYNKPILTINDNSFRKLLYFGHNWYDIIKNQAQIYGTSYLDLDDYNDEELGKVSVINSLIRNKVIDELMIDNNTTNITIPEILEKIVSKK